MLKTSLNLTTELATSLILPFQQDALLQFKTVVVGFVRFFDELLYPHLSY